jgi:hypothetical protein
MQLLGHAGRGFADQVGLHHVAGGVQVVRTVGLAQHVVERGIEGARAVAPQFAGHGQRQVAATQLPEAFRDGGVDTLVEGLVQAVGVVVRLDVLQVGGAGRILQAEGVEDALVEAGLRFRVQDVAGAGAGIALRLAVVEADAVVPAGDVALGRQHDAVVGLLVVAVGRAQFGRTPLEVDGTVVQVQVAGCGWRAAWAASAAGPGPAAPTGTAAAPRLPG